MSTLDLVVAVSAAVGPRVADETFALTLDAVPLAQTEVSDVHGTRFHLAEHVGPGHLSVRYAATLESVAPAVETGPAELIQYRRPSRYCESDRIGPLARSQFVGIEGPDLLSAISSWVGTHIEYVTGSSRPIDGAVATLLAREGVCRDFAHLVIALLRACDVPARFASVYAPGLSPMDFHAVAEAYVDGDWHVVDATCLAPRSAMVRIATGRDAADASFLSTSLGVIRLESVEVTAYTDGDLPVDDVTRLTKLR
ncbi:MAG: transglutaminase family protein [Acidimicrobiia bacterium]